MDEATILDLTRQLDRAIPRDGAIVQIKGDGEMPEDMTCDFRDFRIVANRVGYLRLGVACLQAAFAPHLTQDRGVSDAIKIDTGVLFGENADDPSVKFERTEDLRLQREEAESAPAEWNPWIGQLIGLGAVALIIICFMLGAAALVERVLRVLLSLG